MELQGKTVMVVGAGMSGIASCRYLLSQGARVIIADSKKEEVLLQNKDLTALLKRGVKLLAGHQLPENIDWDMVVVSPGVPLGIPLLKMSRDAAIPVVGEIELAYREAKAPFLAITGTNGKTTTTSLVGHILSSCGVDVLVGGNIGKPLVDAVADFHGKYIVAELSSFQLESCVSFRAHAAAFLNLTPDHLDRHGDMAGYGAAKERIFANQTSEDYAVLNWDDPYLRQAASRIGGKILWFSLHDRPENGIYLDEGQLRYIKDGTEVFSFAAADIFIQGKHNIANCMAAFLMTVITGIEPEKIAKAICSFRGVEHRLEYVTEKNGVIYVNDSKGTNPDSTFQAIYAYDRPMILLLGGRNKGSDLLPLMKLVKERIKCAVLFGEAALQFKQAADTIGYSSYVMADNFDDAVERAKKMAVSGDVVVLSPACASWDSFRCFEERGDRFKELVK